MNIRTLLPAAIVALVAMISLSVYTVDERELAIKVPARQDHRD